MVNIAALQEVWYSDFAHSIVHNAYQDGVYTQRYCVEDEKYVLNPPGLLLLADKNCNFNFLHAGWESYKGECGESLSGWDSQDWPVWKGRVDAICQFTCDAGKPHRIGLFTTHMPVGYGSYTEKVGCSFNYLATSIQCWLNGNKQSTAVLLGDLNIDYYSQTQVGGGTEYQDTVLGPLKTTAGLIDAAAAASNTPLCTIIPETNTLWQYFNGSPTGASNQLIDYFMYANSVDGSMTVEVTSIAPIYPTLTNPALTIVVNEEINGVGPPITLTCSDHYPVDIIATIHGPD
jgi:hypothetical protein